MRYRRLDLNLLVALDALLEEGGVLQDADIVQRRAVNDQQVGMLAGFQGAEQIALWHEARAVGGGAA